MPTTIYRFASLNRADSFASKCTKLHLVVLGDDGMFWVAVPPVTEALVRAGYEYA